MRHLVVGMGEIGSAIIDVLKEGDHNIQTKDVHEENIRGPIDFMHVAIPYNDNFIRAIKTYKNLFKPTYTIVYSTVAVGTCEKLGNDVAHSPVEGIHPHLSTSLKTFTRWIGAKRADVALAVRNLWEPYTECRIVGDPSYTEFLKMYSTSKYGVNIAMADYADQWATELGMDYELVKQFDEDYNKLYHKLRRPGYRRYVLDAPKGPIGGHCVVPNAEILNEQMPHKLLDTILEVK